MSNDTDDLTLAVLRKALEATGSSSWRLATDPCCEAMARVETSPGDATTLVGWTCPIHGLTVRGKNAFDGLAYRTARADWIKRAAQFLGDGIVFKADQDAGAAVLPNAPGRCKVRSSHFHVMDDGRQVFCGGATDKAEPQRQEAIPSSLVAEADRPEHPAPWRWEGNDNDGWRLMDTAGVDILGAGAETDLGWGSGVTDPTPVARELIRLAPEMEEALRAFLGKPESCDVCGAYGGHRDDCKLVAILAALDAARSATP